MATNWRKLTPEERKAGDARRDEVNAACETIKTKHSNILELKVMTSKEFWDHWLPKHPINGMLLRWTAKADRYIGVVSVADGKREYNFSAGSHISPYAALKFAIDVAKVNVEHQGIDLTQLVKDFEPV